MMFRIMYVCYVWTVYYPAIHMSTPKGLPQRCLPICLSESRATEENGKTDGTDATPVSVTFARSPDQTFFVDLIVQGHSVSC